MGRGGTSTTTTTAPRFRYSPELAADRVSVPWREPNDFYAYEAERFSTAADGIPLDPAVAHALLRQPFSSDKFAPFSDWFAPKKGYVTPPEDSCPGMNAAAALLSDAIDVGEKIAVFCDYDVDGLAAGESFRRALAPYGAELLYGYADASTGFGLTAEFVKQAADEACTVLVTLDCGSGQHEQIALARQLGLRVIVVDHHAADRMEANVAHHHLNPNRWRIQRADGSFLTSQPVVANERWGGEVAELIAEGVLSLPAEGSAAPEGPEVVGIDGTGEYRLIRSTSPNTGAQLAWKLGAALQIHKDGKTREEHWQEPLQLAGMGCLADMGSVLLHENRAFFWIANEHVPVGVRALAERFGDDPTCPGGAVKTQACLNLAKRTTAIKTQEIAALLSAETPEEAAPIVERLAPLYEAGSRARKQMAAEAVADCGRAETAADGSVLRPQPEKLVAAHLLDESHREWVGYTGPVAGTLANQTRKPALVICPRGEDEFGQQLYKFSLRSHTSVRPKLGELLSDEQMQAACMVRQRDENGAVVEKASLGGHTGAVSGSVRKEDIPQLIAAVEGWAQRAAAERGGIYWEGSRNSYGKDAVFVSARLLPPERFALAEQQAKQLGPFTFQKQATRFDAALGRATGEGRNKELNVTVAATIEALEPDPETDGDYLKGTLRLDDGSARAITLKATTEAPVGRRCEFLVRLGAPGPLYLSTYSDLQ
jgi:single-stranded DNA-specific DHH superfamily exonuclease